MFSFFRNLFSKKEKTRMVNSNEKTRMVKTKNGIKVELFDDMPDAYADVISECFKTGKIVSGSIDEKGNVKIDSKQGV